MMAHRGGESALHISQLQGKVPRSTPTQDMTHTITDEIFLKNVFISKEIQKCYLFKY